MVTMMKVVNQNQDWQEQSMAAYLYRIINQIGGHDHCTFVCLVELHCGIANIVIKSPY